MGGKRRANADETSITLGQSEGPPEPKRARLRRSSIRVDKMPSLEAVVASGDTQPELTTSAKKARARHSRQVGELSSTFVVKDPEADSEGVGTPSEVRGTELVRPKKKARDRCHNQRVDIDMTPPEVELDSGHTSSAEPVLVDDDDGGIKPEVVFQPKQDRERRRRHTCVAQEVEAEGVDLPPEVCPAELVRPKKKDRNRRHSVRVDKLSPEAEVEDGSTQQEVHRKKARGNRRVKELEGEVNDGHTSPEPVISIPPNQTRDRRRRHVNEPSLIPADLETEVEGAEPVIHKKKHRGRNHSLRVDQLSKPEVEEPDVVIQSKQVRDRCNRHGEETISIPAGQNSESEVDDDHTHRKVKTRKLFDQDSRRKNNPLLPAVSKPKVKKGGSKPEVMLSAKKASDIRRQQDEPPEKPKLKSTGDNNQPDVSKKARERRRRKVDKLEVEDTAPEIVPKKSRRRPREVEPSPPPAVQDSQNVEIIDSDTESEVATKKSRGRRRRQRVIESSDGHESEVAEIVASPPAAVQNPEADLDGTCYVVEDLIECIDVEEESEKNIMIDEIMNGLCQEFGIERPRREEKVVTIKVEKD